MSKSLRRRSCLIALFGALLALGGCVNQQKDVAQYRKVLDGDKPADVHLESGGVLTLTDALRLANLNDEKLAIQGETYLQALITKDEEFANFQPTVSLGATYSIFDTHGDAPGTANHNLSAPASANMNVFNGFRDYSSLASQDQTIEQQKQLLLDMQQTVLLDVIQAYYDVLTSEQSVDVLTNSLKVQQANVDFIQAQVNVGTARPLDLAQAQAQASQTKVSLNQSIANVKTGRIMLAYLVDAPVQNNPLQDNFDPPTDIPDLENWEATAESTRQDLLAADAAVRAARKSVDVAFGQYYPSVSLNFNYFVYQEFNPSSNVWNGAVTGNLPIFTGGLINAEVRAAWSLFRQAALTQSQLRRNVDQDVATSYVDLDLAHTQLAELSIQVEAARDAYFTAQQLYKNGGGTYLDVLTAQDTLLSTQLQLTEEQFTQKTAYFNLLRSVGQLQQTVAESATRPSQVRLQQLATQPATSPSGQP
ncbi:MAG: TolC family protein [Tepidisphaeraceae bacterium]|jgi:outer membrane protein